MVLVYPVICGVASFDPLAFSTNAFSIAAFSITVTEEAAAITEPVLGTAILNSDSTTEVPVNYNLDDHSSFKLFREKGQIDGYGRFSVMGDPRHPIDSPQSGRNDPHQGPQSPEQNDQFVGAVNPEDL